MLEIEASKLYEISGLTKTANGLPRGVTPVNTRKWNLNQNKTIFTNTTLSYAFLQFMSQIHDVACSTSCMILHGLLMDSLLITFWLANLVKFKLIQKPTLQVLAISSRRFVV